MPWWCWSLVANAAITAIEWVNVGAAGRPWSAVILRTAPLILLAQYGLFHAFSGARSWLAAWAFFAIGSSTMRLAAAWLTHPDDVRAWPLVIAGAALMLGGNFLVSWGLRR